MNRIRHHETCEMCRPQPFAYECLPEPSTYMRLISIGATGQDGRIACGLSTWPVEQAPAYSALSYTWGALEPMQHIVLNTRSFPVQPNCHYALQQLSRHYNTAYVWIDSICINQEDLEEKSHQVQMMGQIYQRASGVCACLGQHADDSEILFESLHAVDRMSGGERLGHIEDEQRFAAVVKWFSQKPKHDQWRIHDAYRSFACRPYWERVWIVQELFLAREIILMCGDDAASWSALLNMRLIRMSSPGEVEDGSGPLHDALADDDSDSHHDGRSARIIEGGATNSDEEEESGSDDMTISNKESEDDTDTSSLVDAELSSPLEALIDVVLYAANTPGDLRFENIVSTLHLKKSFDPRDHVYGFLAIIDWASQKPILADYKKMAFDVAVEGLQHFAEIDALQLWTLVQSFLIALDCTPSSPEIAARIAVRQTETLDGVSSNYLGLPENVGSNVMRFNCPPEECSVVGQDQSGNLTVSWTLLKSPIGASRFNELLKVQSELTATELTGAHRHAKLWARGQVIGLAHPNVQAGDILTTLSPRLDHFVGLILRPNHGDKLHVIGQVVLHRSFRPCWGDAECRCGAHESSVHPAMTQGIELRLDPIDYLMLVSQNIVEVEDDESAPDQRLRRLRTRVSWRKDSSYGVRIGEDGVADTSRSWPYRKVKRVETALGIQP